MGAEDAQGLGIEVVGAVTQIVGVSETSPASRFLLPAVLLEGIE